jgi:hypothetical protein
MEMNEEKKTAAAANGKNGKARENKIPEEAEIMEQSFSQQMQPLHVNLSGVEARAE